MEIRLVPGKIEQAPADTIIVNLFEGVTTPGGATGAVDQACGGMITELIAGGDFTGKAGETAVVYPRGLIPARRVVLVGLGKADTLGAEEVRRAAAAGVKRARELNAREVATIVHGSGIAGLDVSAAAQATAEGMLLALYRYEAPKQVPDNDNQIGSLAVVEMDPAKEMVVQQAVDRAVALAAGVFLARELVNLPPNIATPTRLAEAARKIAEEYNMGLVIGDRAWAEERQMGAFLAVAKGAGEEPKFIVLEHNADRTDLETIVFVGKGITFDTGGISIKPSDKMDEMKSDMGGAAAVLGAMKVVGALNFPLRVIGIAPATENMPDANAYRPADVITASNGKTIEIISTDAEGRMVLADALVYAKRYNPQAVIDLATLTGACVIALGEGMAAGLFSNDDKVSNTLVASANQTHERVWPLPLWDDYKQPIKSKVADLKNSGGRGGGVSSSAMFLKEFTDYPWAHLDIAPMALSTKDAPYIPAGGTGYGVRLLVQFLENWS